MDSAGAIFAPALTGPFAMLQACFVALLLVLAGSAPAQRVWPEGKTYAVSLTYDDGLESQIMNAALALDLRGLKASFYPTGTSRDVARHPEAWKALLLRGHELGSHTMTHPCPGAVGKGFQKPEDSLEAYTLERYVKEWKDSLTFLKGLGAKAPFTLAWPCGAAWVGPEHRDVTPEARKHFLAARDAWGGAADPARVDLMHVPSVDGSRTLPVLLGELADAKKKGRWLVFVFHGVGGDYLSVENDAHEGLLDALAADSQAWVAPFGTVAAAVARLQKGR